MAEQITVTIKGGKVQVAVDGVKGRSCTEITKALRNAIGTTVSDHKTADYWKEGEAHVRH